jgi:hypothetical protein
VILDELGQAYDATSANTLIRLLRNLPDEPVSAAPRVLGVDDFAVKKGHVYL